MYTMQAPQITSQIPAKPDHPVKQIAKHLQLVFGVALIMATLFTAWTPNETRLDGEIRQIQTPMPATQLSGSPIPTPQGAMVVGIVAGHWKNDSGAVCNDGTTEVDINLKIASLVQKSLVELGYVVDLLAEFDDRLTGYQATALISIHADSCEYVNDQATGYKVAAAYATLHPERAGRLTACLRNRYANATQLPLHSTSVTRDMTRYHAFSEIDENTPAAIIETGFMNLDYQILTQTPELPAQGIVDGIICYLTNQSVPAPTIQTSP